MARSQQVLVNHVLHNMVFVKRDKVDYVWSGMASGGGTAVLQVFCDEIPEELPTQEKILNDLSKTLHPATCTVAGCF